MEARFIDFPRALAATAEIAPRCAACLPDGRPIWPVIHEPARSSETWRVLRQQSHDEALTDLAGGVDQDLWGGSGPGCGRTAGSGTGGDCQPRLCAPLSAGGGNLVAFARSRQFP